MDPTPEIITKFFDTADPSYKKKIEDFEKQHPNGQAILLIHRKEDANGGRFIASP
jgi:hypothetical protein